MHRFSEVEITAGSSFLKLKLQGSCYCFQPCRFGTQEMHARSVMVGHKPTKAGRIQDYLDSWADLGVLASVASHSCKTAMRSKPQLSGMKRICWQYSAVHVIVSLPL